MFAGERCNSSDGCVSWAFSDSCGHHEFNGTQRDVRQIHGMVSLLKLQQGADCDWIQNWRLQDQPLIARRESENLTS